MLVIYIISKDRQFLSIVHPLMKLSISMNESNQVTWQCKSNNKREPRKYTDWFHSKNYCTVVRKQLVLKTVTLYRQLNKSQLFIPVFICSLVKGKKNQSIESTFCLHLVTTSNRIHILYQYAAPFEMIIKKININPAYNILHRYC